MDDDLAWDKYDELVDGYFNMRHAINNISEEQKLQLAIFNADSKENAVLASAELDRYRKKQIKEKDETIEKQKTELIQKDNTIEYKEDVIIGLVKDITMAERRQRLNQIVKKKGSNFQERYSLLYNEFNKVYHLDIATRLNNAKKNGKVKKNTSKMDYICNYMNMTNELYDICCKLFENDLDILVDEFKNIVK